MGVPEIAFLGRLRGSSGRKTRKPSMWRNEYGVHFTSVVCRHPCKSLSREKTVLLTRATEERAKTNVFRTRSSHGLPLGSGSCLRRTGHPFAVFGPGEPSQKIEFVFSASPETIRKEPREFDLLRSVGHLRDLAACAPWNPVIFFLTPVGGLSRRRASPFRRHEVPFPAIHG